MISILFIVIFIIKLIAFALSVPLNGYLTSLLITKRSYDKTYAYDEHAENPFEYFDFFGSLCFVFLGFGWGTILPVDQEYISGRNKLIRTILGYSAQPLVSFFLAICAIIPSVFLTGRACIHTVLHMFFASSLHTANSDSARYIFQQNAIRFAECSPYAITATLFLIGIVFVQTSVLCISMVRNAFQAAIYPFRYQIMMSQYSWLLMIVIPLAFCIIFYQFFFAVTLSCIFWSIELFSVLLKGV
ncbi:MAG: hypothetical protein K2X90_03655 [Candidatus Babeliaceae bacterium]|nr:hypothetical protein [Candidatus Babeliaceae bacterium]